MWAGATSGKYHCSFYIVRILMDLPFYHNSVYAAMNHSINTIQTELDSEKKQILGFQLCPDYHLCVVHLGSLGSSLK